MEENIYKGGSDARQVGRGLDRGLAETTAFLRAVFGRAIGPGRHVVVFALPGAFSKGFVSISAAAGYASRLASRRDVYVGAGLYRRARRGGAEEVSGLVGLWADIDFAGPAHPKPGLPQDERDARQILARLPRWPSIIVHSGHGLQCWWLFDEALSIGSDSGRGFATSLVRGWTDEVRRQARAAGGWEVDPTGDLARVLRLPGTWNRKVDPAVPVRVIEPVDLKGRIARYRPEEFRAFAAGPEPSMPRPAGARSWRLRLEPGARPPAAKFALLLADSRKFERTWHRDRPDMADQSPSAYDLSLAAMAASAGWQDQEIADLLIAWRRVHGERLKLRQDYYRRTIARARHRGRSGPRVGPVASPGARGGADGNAGGADSTQRGGDGRCSTRRR